MSFKPNYAGRWAILCAWNSSIPTPAIDRLYAYIDLPTLRMPEGSAEIPLDWRGVWIGLGALAGISFSGFC